MTDPSDLKALGQRVRQARLDRGWSQTRLAEAVSRTVGRVSQSQISQFEAGREGVLSLRKIAAVTAALGLEVIPDVLPELAGPLRLGLKLCPTQDCPGHHALLAGGRPVLRPVLREAPLDHPSHCPDCGDILLARCECGEPLHDGAFCPACGAAYLPVDLDPGTDAAAWVAERRSEREALTRAAPIQRLVHGSRQASPAPSDSPAGARREG